jgi:Protein of unknown function (DUF3108)
MYTVPFLRYSAAASIQSQSKLLTHDVHDLGCRQRSRVDRLHWLASYAWCALVLMGVTAWPHAARGQGKVDATYAITFARISVGNATLGVDFKESDYSITATGRVGGAMRVLLNGEAFLTTHGIVNDGRPEPQNFTSKIKSGEESDAVTMSLEAGNVTELLPRPAPSTGAPVTDADRQGIIDPLSAMLIPADGTGEELRQAACQRTLPIFDGRYRYNLKLAFKRMDKLSAGKAYAGPVIVCSLEYQPIAGLGASTPLVKYLSEGREMELVLAPMPGTRVLVPVRFVVVSMLANLVIEVDRLEAVAQPSAAPPATEPKRE